jgi:hypothetical protein
MALYHEKAKYAAQLIDKLATQYPGLNKDPMLYELIHTTCRAMPRVQTAVEEGYVREVVKLTGNKVSVVPKDAENWKGETYKTIEVVAKKLSDFVG